MCPGGEMVNVLVGEAKVKKQVSDVANRTE